MEDAINTGAWQQPNTFMDIVAPRKSASPRSMPSKSATLMRNAVRKPEPAPAIIQDQTILSKPEAAKPNYQETMSLTDQSPLVSRFSSNSTYQQEAIAEPIQQPISSESIEQPAEDNVEAMMTSSMDGAPAPIEIEEPAYDEQLADLSEAVPAAELAVPQPALNVFNQAPSIESIDYRQKTKRSRRFSLSSIKRMSGWTVLAIAVIGLAGGGIYVSRNFSTLELYLASSRAGFSATLPGTKPSGYSLTGISTASGVIEAAFKSNTGGRNYTISEKKSSLSSGSLLAGYVTNQAGLNYQMVSSGNLIIYIYNNHDATWVNKGIWYVVQDNNSLSDHQIISIADTM